MMGPGPSCPACLRVDVELWCEMRATFIQHSRLPLERDARTHRRVVARERHLGGDPLEREGLGVRPQLSTFRQVGKDLAQYGRELHGMPTATRCDHDRPTAAIRVLRIRSHRPRAGLCHVRAIRDESGRMRCNPLAIALLLEFATLPLGGIRKPGRLVAIIETNLVALAWRRQTVDAHLAVGLKIDKRRTAPRCPLHASTRPAQSLGRAGG